MAEETLLDTGPLVAFLAADEEFHDWAVVSFQHLQPKFLTCEAVLAEAFYLLDFAPEAMRKIESFLEQGWIKVPFHFEVERRAVMKLMRQYQNVPMSLADACLVRMAELYNGLQVFTLDSDFRIYRKYGNRGISLIIPERH